MTSPLVEELGAGEDPAHYIRPADRDPHALIVYLHWFDEAPNANRDQFLDEAHHMAENGFASILPQLSFPWKTPPAGADHDVDQIRSEVAGLERLTAEATEASSTTKVVIVGHDFGAMHGMLLARTIASECLVSIAATPRWADWFLAFWPIEEDRYDYLRALEPLDPITVARDLTMPTFFQFARNDFYIAPMSGQLLARSTPEPNRLEAYDADHSMSDPRCRDERIEFIRGCLDIGAPSEP